jgi:hypothetical protein
MTLRKVNVWNHYISSGFIHDIHGITTSDKNEKLVIYKILWVLYKYIYYYNIQLQQTISKYESLIKLLKYNNMIQEINYINYIASLNLINDTNLCKLKIIELKTILGEIKLIYNYYLRLFNYT